MAAARVDPKDVLSIAAQITAAVVSNQGLDAASSGVTRQRAVSIARSLIQEVARQTDET